MRRMALPSVIPKPRSSGSATMVATRVRSDPGSTWSFSGFSSNYAFGRVALTVDVGLPKNAFDLLRVFFLTLLHRAAVQALGSGIAVHQLDQGHVSGIAVANAGFQNAAIAARTALVAFGQRAK